MKEIRKQLLDTKRTVQQLQKKYDLALAPFSNKK